MGGFYLTNSIDSDVQKKVIKLFNRKGMINYEQISIGTYKVFYFPKIVLKTNHVYRNGNDVIVGVGVFFYGGDYGFKALEAIYRDYKEFGSKIFSDVKGHFNFILGVDDTVKIVTDKTGTYHSFFAKEKDTWHISSSLLAIAENLSRLTPQLQEMMEFIHTEAVYAGKTIFKEINFLPFGNVIDTGSMLKNNIYFDIRLHEQKYSTDYLFKLIRENINFLKGLDLKISSEISAGYDSRLIFAILKNAKIPHILNTNWNSENANDSKIAEFIAQQEKCDIKVIKKNADSKIYAELIRRCVDVMEMSRCSLRGAYAPVFFDEKAHHADLILGGWGGELYRDKKYKGVKDLEGFILKLFYTKDLYEADEVCKANLKNKIIKFLNLDTRRSGKEIAERVYYFVRIAYWGGSRISCFNQYTYHYHPLMDYAFAYPIFAITDREKKNGKFQMKMIERFDPKLARYKSQYGYNFHWYAGKDTVIKLTNRLHKYKEKIIKRTKPINRFYLEDHLVHELIGNNSSVLFSDLKMPRSSVHPNTMARIYTIQHLLLKLKCFDQPIKKLVHAG